jgi:hypothetical protein
MIGTEESTTLLQITRPLPVLASTRCDEFRSRLITRLKYAYSLSDLYISISIVKEDMEVDEVYIDQFDPFYVNQKKSLRKDPLSVKLWVVPPNNPKDKIRVIEENIEKRSWKKTPTDVSYTNGTKESPRFYDLATMQVVDNPITHPYPDTKSPIEMSMILAFLTKETYDSENEEVRKKGIWFRRGPRMVAIGETLGIHGINAHGHYNQMRACVCFPPSMDKYMGAKYNKGLTINPGPIKDAIIRIWKDITSEWVKEKETKRKQIKESHGQQNEEEGERNAKKDETNSSVSNKNTLGTFGIHVLKQQEPEIEVPEPPYIGVEGTNVCLKVKGETQSKVDGFGQNCHLRKYLERVLQRKGWQKTKELIIAMNASLI